MFVSTRDGSTIAVSKAFYDATIDHDLLFAEGWGFYAEGVIDHELGAVGWIVDVCDHVIGWRAHIKESDGSVTSCICGTLKEAVLFVERNGKPAHEPIDTAKLAEADELLRSF